MRVVNLKTESYDVYIGRKNITYNLEDSKWKNPFSLDLYNREEAVSLYETYVRQSELYNQLDELEGKTLGCWCPSQDKCHGGVLIKLFNEKRLNDILNTF